MERCEEILFKLTYSRLGLVCNADRKYIQKG